jgi:membrane protease YdiL (CAAX protease family)
MSGRVKFDTFMNAKVKNYTSKMQGMDNNTENSPEQRWPFENLYLISGLVNGLNKAWMYVFTVLLLVFGYVSYQLVAFLPLQYVLMQNGYSQSEILNNPSLLLDGNALGIDRNYVLLAELGMFVFAFIGFYAGIRLMHRKSLLSVISGYDKFRYGRFFYGFIVWGGLIIISTLLELIISPDSFHLNINLPGLLVSFVIAVSLMPIQSGLEEIFFRGYLIQGFSQLFRNGAIPLVITSLLFGFAHMGNPEVQEYGWPLMLAYYTSFGLFMGAVSLLDEGLELALGIHMANNIISGLLVTDPHAVIKSYSVFESTQINVPMELLMWFVMATLCFIIFWLRYRWKNFKLILK